MARRNGSNGATRFEMTSRRTVRTIEVAGEMPGGLANGAVLIARWQQWSGRGTADLESTPTEEQPRDDYELGLGFFGLGDRASWSTGKRNHEEYGQLGGTDLNPRVIRAYGTLLLELADKVEAANTAESSAEREHDRLMRRNLRRA